MTFEQRFDQIMARVDVPPTTWLWLRAFEVSVMCVGLCAMYIFFQGMWDGLVSVNRAVANAAMIMIGLSFLGSSVCYFWDFADKLIIYRKYWGLMGFWLVCVHGLISLAQRDFDLGFFLLPQNIVAFMCALGAFVILAMMALISNTFSVRKIGGKKWRALLRTGYLAYVLGIIHLTLKALPQWQSMTDQVVPLPPLSLIVGVLGMGVIAMRLVLTVALSQDK